MSKDMITQNESGNKEPDWQLGDEAYLNNDGLSDGWFVGRIIEVQPEWALVRLRSGKSYLFHLGEVRQEQ